MNIIIPEHAEKILNSQQIIEKVNRMAYQILELVHQEEEIVMLGVEDGGFHLAGQMALKMQTIRDIKIHLSSIYINKPEPLSETVLIREPDGEWKNKTFILVDDVGNTGKTLFYILSSLYDFQPKAVHVALLVDRTHKRFPVQSDIVGIQLATTFTEHIHVVFNADGSAEGAYLY